MYMWHIHVTYHCKFDTPRHRFAIEDGLYEQDDWSGQSLCQLIRSNRVVLQREVSEHHKTTEGGGEREGLFDHQPLW